MPPKPESNDDDKQVEISRALSQYIQSLDSDDARMEFVIAELGRIAKQSFSSETIANPVFGDAVGQMYQKLLDFAVQRLYLDENFADLRSKLFQEIDRLKKNPDAEPSSYDYFIEKFIAHGLSADDVRSKLLENLSVNAIEFVDDFVRDLFVTNYNESIDDLACSEVLNRFLIRFEEISQQLQSVEAVQLNEEVLQAVFVGENFPTMEAFFGLTEKDDICELDEKAIQILDACIAKNRVDEPDFEYLRELAGAGKISGSIAEHFMKYLHDHAPVQDQVKYVWDEGFKFDPKKYPDEMIDKENVLPHAISDMLKEFYAWQDAKRQYQAFCNLFESRQLQDQGQFRHYLQMRQAKEQLRNPQVQVAPTEERSMGQYQVFVGERCSSTDFIRFILNDTDVSSLLVSKEFMASVLGYFGELKYPGRVEMTTKSEVIRLAVHGFYCLLKVDTNLCRSFLTTFVEHYQSLSALELKVLQSFAAAQKIKLIDLNTSLDFMKKFNEIVDLPIDTICREEQQAQTSSVNESILSQDNSLGNYSRYFSSPIRVSSNFDNVNVSSIHAGISTPKTPQSLRKRVLLQQARRLSFGNDSMQSAGSPLKQSSVGSSDASESNASEARGDDISWNSHTYRSFRVPERTVDAPTSTAMMRHAIEADQPPSPEAGVVEEPVVRQPESPVQPVSNSSPVLMPIVVTAIAEETVEPTKTSDGFEAVNTSATVGCGSFG